MAFTVQSASCWATRLQAPQPDSAPVIATTDAKIVATLSAAANTRKRRSRVMRALATARLPPRSRTGVSAISTKVSCGAENARLAGQASRQMTAASPAQTSSAIQNTVDSSRRDGCCTRTSAFPSPMSQIRFANRMKGIASATTP